LLLVFGGLTEAGEGTAKRSVHGPNRGCTEAVTNALAKAKSTVLTGSFNDSKAAEESNSENLFVSADPVSAAEYSANWNHHARSAKAHVRKAAVVATR
jgi:hypothetical protein